MRHALSDLRVAQLTSGPPESYCAKLFADLGADVVLAGPVAVPRDGAYLHLHTNKRLSDSPVDLGEADLVIQSPGPGARFDWEALHERYPALSVVHISGFGATGPYAGYGWSDLVVQAFSGTLLLQNQEDQDPLKLPARTGLHFVGSMAALAGLAAAVWARRSGEGSFVDCAAVEALASTPYRATFVLSHQYRAGEPGPGTPSGNRETLIPTGVFPCADGYMAMMSTPQQLKEMLDVLDDDNLRAAFARPDAFERGETKEAIDAALYPWLLSHTRAEATAEAQAAGWPLAGVNSPHEVLEAPHLHQRGFWVHSDDPVVGPVDLPGPAHRHGEGGWALRRAAPVASSSGQGWLSRSAATRGTPGRLPLEGIRIVDLTTVWAGPYATMLLADLGAEVIRVENPFVLPPTTKGYTARPTISDLGVMSSGYGPLAPGRPDRPWNRHAMNNCLCRNKLSCTIDTRQPEGMELLMALVERSDVFVENFKASGLARMGIHTDVLLARNPRLVVLRLPPAGLAGDWSGYTGFGAQFDGLTSLLWLCGHRDADLTSSPATTYMDAASGPAGAFAILTALHYREATGRGQLVELAQSENVLNHLGDVFVDCQLGVEPRKDGNRDPRRAPQGLYRCRDGQWLALSVGDNSEWEALAAQVGVSPDPRFADLAGRLAHHDELEDLLSGWAKDQDVESAFHDLQAAGVPAAPLLEDGAFAADPHMAARGWLQPLDQTDVGTHLHPGQPYRGVPQAWRRASPNLGEDNEYVYKTVLGVTDADYERYQKLHHIAEDYLSKDGDPL